MTETILEIKYVSYCSLQPWFETLLSIINICPITPEMRRKTYAGLHEMGPVRLFDSNWTWNILTNSIKTPQYHISILELLHADRRACTFLQTIYRDGGKNSQ
jgi:hypothetical protein